MARKLSFKAADENSLTIAETWLEKIDRPWVNAKRSRSYTDIDLNAVRRMKEAAVEEIQDASPRYTSLYVFSDGSGLYEKRQHDWFLADQETIAEAQKNN